MAHSIPYDYGQQDPITARAARLYESALNQSLAERLRALLAGPPRLEVLGDGGRLSPAFARTLQQVSLSQIRGTAAEGRRRDFDSRFRPLQQHNRDRWLNVAQARLRSARLPPVTLIQVDDDYYVQDGHHRISVAAALGDERIAAQVTPWQVLGEAPDSCLPKPMLV